ncbi:hypothetical protein Hanom_Chr14g01261221 [Helianthus anomalus]
MQTTYQSQILRIIYQQTNTCYLEPKQNTTGEGKNGVKRTTALSMPSKDAETKPSGDTY